MLITGASRGIGAATARAAATAGWDVAVNYRSERERAEQLAAELAEARALDPDLVVRLWWRAGRRDRAVTVARVRNAFVGAIDRLSKVDKDAATGLRREWIRSCRLAGDHLAAVEAAWSIRPADSRSTAASR